MAHRARSTSTRRRSTATRSSTRSWRPSIVELALAHAARADGDRLEAFWAQAMRLRDLLKFDFYFADSAAFREHIAEEMAWHDGLGSPRRRRR